MEKIVTSDASDDRVLAVDVLLEYYRQDTDRLLTDCDLGDSTEHPFIGTFDERLVVWNTDEDSYYGVGYYWLSQTHYPDRDPFDDFDDQRDWYPVANSHVKNVEELDEVVQDWLRKLRNRRSYQ